MSKNSIFFIFYICFISEFFNNAYADTISMIFDNDAFVNRDGGGYTNGLRFVWLSGELKDADTNGSRKFENTVTQNTTKNLSFLHLNTHKKHNVGVSLYQMIFTPKDLSKSEPDFYDMPYAGYLTASIFLFEWDEKSYAEYAFNVGIVGPLSGAEAAQKIAHKVTANKAPAGWDNQLGNHLTAGIAYGYGLKSFQNRYDNGFDTDWVNSLRLQLGNFYSGASVGSIWRIGKNYPKNFSTYYPASPANMGNSALLELKKRSTKPGYSFSMGVIADAIAYFYVIDAAKGYHIDRNIFSAGVVGSASLYFDSMEVSFSMRTHTGLIKHAENEVSFGAISVLWYF